MPSVNVAVTPADGLNAVFLSSVTSGGTPQTVYSDSSLTTAVSLPLIVTPATPGTVYISAGTYVATVTQSSGATVAAESFTATGPATGIRVTVNGAGPGTARIDASAGAVASSLPAAADAGSGAVIRVQKADGSANAVTVKPFGSDVINTADTVVALPGGGDHVEFRSDGISKWVAAQAAVYGRLRGVPRGAICFTWDDGYVSHDVVRAYATSRGQRHTFFLTSDLAPGQGNPTYLSSSQILQAFREGHEIGAHGQTHVDMTGVATGSRPAQYDTPKSVLEGIIGTGNVKSWAYPLGTRNATTDTELYLRYDRLACISFTGGLGEPSPVYDIAERNIGHFLIGRVNWDNSAAAQTRVLNYIRMAASSPVIVSFYAHALDGAAGPSTANMKAAVDLAASLGVPCLTMSEAFPPGNVLLDAGCEDTTFSSWGTVSTDPSSVQEIIADTPFTNFVGSNSLHLKCTDATKAVYVSQPFPMLPGRNYTFSGRVRTSITSGTVGVYARIRQLDVAGGNLATNASTTVAATAAWQSFSAATAAANNKTVYGTVELVVDSVVGEAWFDHLHVAPSAVGSFG